MNPRLTLIPNTPVIIRDIPRKTRLVSGICDMLDMLAVTVKRSLEHRDIDDGVTSAEAAEILCAIFTAGAFIAIDEDDPAKRHSADGAVVQDITLLYPLPRTISSGRYFVDQQGKLLYRDTPSDLDRRIATVTADELQVTPLSELYQMREDLRHLVAYVAQQLRLT